MIRIAIVEDDDTAREQLRSYLQRYRQETGTTIQIETYEDGAVLAQRFDHDTAYDIILLDIEMRQMDGMQTAARIRQSNTDVTIIFITNMAQYVIKGYEVGALDYVIKPVSYAIFREKINKAQRRSAMRAGRFLMIRSKEQIHRIYTRDIRYIEVRNHELVYHTESGDYMCTGNLGRVQRDLEGLPYARCSASYLVHLPHIDQVQADQLVMDNGDILPISRTKRQEFMQSLTDYYGGWGMRDV